jgi:hypothetical protein
MPVSNVRHHYDLFIGLTTLKHESPKYLSVFDSRFESVAHRTDVEPLFTLQITLSKEFFHYTVGPLAVEIKRFSRIAEVSAVNQGLQDLHV